MCLAQGAVEARTRDPQTTIKHATLPSMQRVNLFYTSDS